MRAFTRAPALVAIALGGAAGGACVSVTETGTQRGYPGAGGAPDAAASDAQRDGALRSVPVSPVSDADVHPRRVDRRDVEAGLGAARDAATVGRDARPDGGDVVSVDGSPASRDSSDATVDARPTAPDCTCPDLGFFLDASTGASSMHLTAPYTLGIYCTETTVQLGHPLCGGVYRLSACNGPDDAPPCVYLAVDRPGRFLLGNYVDGDSAPWDILGGDIVPDAPSGRVETGTFSATMRPRDGGDTVMLSGSFRACVTRMPACSS